MTAAEPFDVVLWGPTVRVGVLQDESEDAAYDLRPLKKVPLCRPSTSQHRSIRKSALFLWPKRDGLGMRYLTGPFASPSWEGPLS